MELLQISFKEVNTYVLQYGILGIIAVLLGYFAYSTYTSIAKKNEEEYKRLLDRNEKLEEEVEKLREEMMELIVEERDRMATLVKANTEAIVELRKTIIDYLLKQ
jgi:F0F1-type ATP synthase membrane subunit b/b'